MIECGKCGKLFNYQVHLNAHLEISTHCKSISTEINEIKSLEDNKCDKCGKTYSNVSNLRKHQKNINGKCNIKAVAKLIEDKLITNKPIQKDVKIVNNIKNVHKHKHVQNNFIMVKSGNENIDHITRDVFLSLLSCKSFPDMSLKLLDTLYFNIKVPQNCNWCLAYPKNEDAGIELDEESEKFERTNTLDIINKKFLNMFNLCFNLIDQIYQENKDNQFLTHLQYKNLLKCYDYIEQESILEEDEHIYNIIREFAYKNRSIPMNEWKKQGFSGNHLSLKF